MLPSAFCVLAFGAEGVERPSAGWRPPTEEEIREYAKRATRIQEVRLNPLGRRRINDALRGRAGAKAVLVPESEAVPYGEEIVGAPRTSTAPRGREVPAGSKAAPDVLPRRVKALPAAVDNSALSWFPPIRSQGALASCTCFATTYYQMTHMTAMVREWDAKSGGDAYRFSPKWTYNLIYDYIQAPSLLAAHCVLMDHGAATWAEFPYDGNFTEWCLAAGVWRRAIGFRLAQVGTVSDLDTDAGMLGLKQLLNDGFVLVFPTYILSWQLKTVPNDPSTSADDPWVGQQICRYVFGTQGGHGMTIVGYNDHVWCDVNENGTVDAGEKGALKVAGSWGTSYGNGGCYWICYDALKAVSAVANGPSTNRVPAVTGCAARWMTAHPSYVPRMVAVFRVSHESRWQMSMRLGKSVTAQTTPSATWEPYALTGDGGDLAFDGSFSRACDGSFALDFSDLAPDAGLQMRYYCGMSEHAFWPETGVIKEFELVDYSGAVLGAASGVPLEIDGITDYVYVDYTYVPQIAADAEVVYVREGSTGSFGVRLSEDPGGNVSVDVVKLSGDADITIVGAPVVLEFDSANWETYQAVELIAAVDEDDKNGSALVDCSAPGLANRTVTVRELDADRGSGPACSTGRAGVLAVVLLMLAVCALRCRARRAR